MARNNLNLDNKFGNCCNCPGFVNDDRLFTNYVSSRIYNDSTMKKLNSSIQRFNNQKTLSVFFSKKSSNVNLKSTLFTCHKI